MLPTAASRGRRASASLKFLMFLFRDTEEVGDDEEGERVGVVPDELALTAIDPLVDLPVGEPPHEFLVLLQPFRGELPHEQMPVVTMLGRVHRGDLVAERQLVAVFLDDLAHVVALERDRKPGERTAHRIARRERVGVGVDGARLLVAGDHVDTVLRLTVDGTLGPQPVEIGIGVGDELVPAEEVDVVVVGGHVAHGSSRVTGPLRSITGRGRRPVARAGSR